MSSYVRILDPTTRQESNALLSDLILAYWDRITINCPASQSTIVQTFTFSNLKSTEHHFSLYNETEDKGKSFNVKIQRNDGAIKQTVYAKLGKLNIALDVSVNAGNVEVAIQNNESFDLELTLDFKFQ